MEKMTLMDSKDPTHLLMEKSTNLRRRYFLNLPLVSAGVSTPTFTTYLEIRVHGEVVKVQLDPERSVVPCAVGVVEAGDGTGDVEVDHVLLDLLGEIVAVPGPVPGKAQLGLGSLDGYVSGVVKGKNVS